MSRTFFRNHAAVKSSPINTRPVRATPRSPPRASPRVSPSLSSDAALIYTTAEKLCVAVERLREVTDRLQLRLADARERTSAAPLHAPSADCPLRQRAAPRPPRGTGDGDGVLTALTVRGKAPGALDCSPRGKARDDSPLIVELQTASGVHTHVEEGPHGETANHILLRKRAMAIEEELSRYASDLFELERDVVEAQEQGLVDMQSTATRDLRLGVQDELNASRMRALKIATLVNELRTPIRKMH